MEKDALKLSELGRIINAEAYDLDEKIDRLEDFFKIKKGGTKMQMIGKIRLNEAILDDLRNFFWSSIYFADVPAAEFCSSEHITWGSRDELPDPTEKIGDYWHGEAYRYDFMMFRAYIFFEKGSKPSLFLADPSLDTSPASWVNIFAYVHGTKDPVILAETLAEYGLDGMEALLLATCTDTDVAIWVNYHFDKFLDYYDYDPQYRCGFLYPDKSSSQHNPFMPRYFSTYGEAKKFVDDYLSSRYELRPYELARPTYTIVDTTRDAAYL